MAAPSPLLPFLHLDALWLQITGTRCNIACRHCFISCGPKVERHAVMTGEQVRRAIDEAEGLGCRGYWFTGGEPFLHPEILGLIGYALGRGPLGILTNGMLITPEIAAALRAAADRSEYSLDLRVSLDGLTAEENDGIRGRGVFGAACAGIRALAAVGLEPAIAVTTVHAAHARPEGRAAFLGLLRGLGVARPRLKLIPPFRIGREARRGGDGAADHAVGGRIRAEELDDQAPWVLQCGTSRMVTAGGVYACPILIDAPVARLGDTLAEALRPAALGHPACRTCLTEGFSCRT